MPSRRPNLKSTSDRLGDAVLPKSAKTAYKKAFLRGNIRQPLGDNRGDANTKLITMHSSKGLEFPLVCIPAIGALGKEDNDAQDEARLLYVAMTRATQQLVMTHGEMSRLSQNMHKAMGVLNAL